MTIQFKRRASLRIGPEGQAGREIRGLRMIFSISKSTDKTPNKCSLQIYNLSEDTRNLIPDEEEKNGIAFLSAGYDNGDAEVLIFGGNITRVSHQLIPPDIITDIEMEDGTKEMRETKFNRSYAEGVKGSDILNDILQAFPSGKKSRTVQFVDTIFSKGWVHSGLARDALTKVSETLGLEWSFQNGNEIKLVGKDRTDNSTVVVVSPDTGLIGSPERINQTVRKSQKKTKKTKPGWSIRSLLQPLIEPGGRVSLQSRQIPNATVFRVDRVNHSGDTHGQEWTTVTEVTEPEFTII